VLCHSVRGVPAALEMWGLEHTRLALSYCRQPTQGKLLRVTSLRNYYHAQFDAQQEEDGPAHYILLFSKLSDKQALPLTPVCCNR
jgi:hypothetical protein